MAGQGEAGECRESMKTLMMLVLLLLLHALVSAQKGCEAALILKRRLGPNSSSPLIESHTFRSSLLATKYPAAAAASTSTTVAPVAAAASANSNHGGDGHSSASRSCQAGAPAFSPVFAFGDSTTDTGNNPGGSSSLPYGSTFFHEPTGRYSDGRLMVDFLCQALGVPLLPAHRRSTNYGQQSHNVNENFAVAGATALDVDTLRELAGVSSSTPDSLDVQVGWLLADLAGRDDVNMTNALVYMGEIGGNDYNYAWSSVRSNPSSVAALVPSVVEKLASELEHRILSTGVKRVVVQGEFPMGCMATYMSRFASSPHDAHGCITHITAVSDRHNQLLTDTLQDIASRHPDVSIVFLDTSAAFLHVLDHASDYGFTDTRGACFPRFMSSSSSSAGPCPCTDPSRFISWDGLHLTDAMYGAMMGLLLNDSTFSSPSPSFLTTAAASCRAPSH